METWTKTASVCAVTLYRFIMRHFYWFDIFVAIRQLLSPLLCLEFITFFLHHGLLVTNNRTQ